ncbi:MAG: FtsX-like permease family protein [Ruminococcus sp.]|nr:FtsX-like permease family protein [Ruminococcus sp.]
MKAGFYPNLAFDGIRKNRRLYLPYIITCVAMVMMYYIMSFLQSTDALSNVRGIETIREMLDFGTWVIAIFSCIFLFYTNSFLIRRRKKEFGLFYILGMGKSNISIILFWEVLIIYAISIIAGLFLGMVLSKTAELSLIYVMQGEVTYNVSVSIDSAVMSIFVFGVIFFLLYLNALRQIKLSNAISLLKSETVGEKAPKANWFFGILGVLILATGYILSVSTENPISALLALFVAVILVIIGTYITMISGSVLFCKILQKNKKYYYKSNHFVSVSSMVYRMKRNGAGLASICILATMVLVMISSTASLYIGVEDAIQNRYPKEINLTIDCDNLSEKSKTETNMILEEVRLIAERYNTKPQNAIDYGEAYVAGLVTGNTVETDVTAAEGNFSYSDIVMFNFISLEDYNQAMGTSESLKDGEAFLYSSKYDYTENNISFNNGNAFKIKRRLYRIFDKEGETDILPIVDLIVPNIDYAVQGLDKLADYNGDRMVTFTRYYQFDTGLDTDKQIALYKELVSDIPTETDKYSDEDSINYIRISSREVQKDSFYSLNGGLFYLGIILSLVFIFAAVLIIYYKQISEGYEDRARFEIMQKIGMTKRELRKSINSQLLTVFFLPLIISGLHLTFAFPLISKIIIMFGLYNTSLFMLTSIACFIIFAIIYAVVYKITSNSYYKIVSGAKKNSF